MQRIQRTVNKPNTSRPLPDVAAGWNSLRSLAAGLAAPGAAYPCELEGFQGSSLAFFAAELLRAQSRDLAFIVAGENEALELAADIAAVSPGTPVCRFPWWGAVPYRAVHRANRVFGDRAAALAALAEAEAEPSRPRVFILTQRALQTPVPPPDYFRSLLFSVRTGEALDPPRFAERLIRAGYMRVPRVTVRGEFALRGEVLDIFMSGAEHACRIVFDFDAVGKIRTFDPETQSTLEARKALTVRPMKEVIWDDALIDTLTRYLEQAGTSGYAAGGNRREAGAADSGLGTASGEIKPALLQAGIDKLVGELISGGESEGEELFYPVLFGRRASVLEYLPDEATVVFADYDRIENAEESLKKEYAGLYRREQFLRPVPRPADILLPFAALEEAHPKRIRVRTVARESALPRRRIELDPPRNFFGNVAYLKETLAALLAAGWRVFVYAESENQALRIGELLREFTAGRDAAPSAKNAAPAVFIVPESLTAGFGIPETKTLVIQENEIFTRRKRIPKSAKHVKSAVIDTFIELNQGDYVVHVNYGIGRFIGIERVKAAGNERDYIKLEYADEELIFIPIEQVNLVQRYIGNADAPPRLDHIGSKSWAARKSRVQKSVEDIAQKLIELYSKRKASRGFAFPKDTEWQTAFEAGFPWEETDDQLTAAAEVKADMEKPAPMDRLICGDVGFGKTEIALRAAFKAVMGGKQAVFLAPTTLLAEQHYETCLERFENFPVRVAHLSRMIPRAEQQDILRRLAAGEIDILVGTHRVIQKDVRFKDLGFMIVDEEQRFGVKDKERLKELKANIDCLAMSATPIPRTLHMSLLKIRDMSLLATPPANRQAIETVIDAYRDERVVSAIRAEVERGGQVFYLHNRVETLDEARLRLERLVPEMLIGTAHGQMATHEMDDVFRRFKMGGFHVLVATTIIENGIDIPNVNTIIIDRADIYGVSQLYQLRGRVGRSDRKAYAYLLYPEEKALSEIAMKRLQVVSDFTELGSGFKIAMKDMEIRGAGNLLGRDQSGDVYSVGFDLYLRLLEEAIQRLADERYEAANEALLELEYTGFIPDTYITSPQIKMEVYKKIASLSTRDEIDRVYRELEDRFGPVADEVASLLSLAEIRVLCKKLAIDAVTEKNGTIRVEFGKVSRISAERVLRLIGESGGRVKLDPEKPNVLLFAAGNISLAEKSEYLREKLEAFAV